MGDLINIFLDNLIALTWRLLDLPLFVLILTAVAISVVLWWLLKRIFLRKDPSLRKRKSLLIFLGAFFIVTMGFIFDYKVSLYKGEMESLNEKYMLLLEAQKGTANAGSWTTSFDEIKGPLMDSARNVFSTPIQLTEQPVNPATNLLILKKEAEPKAVAFIAVIDLTFPGLELVITPELPEKKFKTSKFARDNNCDLAINGEAGRTMFPGCGLGEYSGNWVVNGNPVSLVDSDIRPFMGFDKRNMAYYSKQAIVDRTMGPEKYNCFWGRHDILVDGEILTFSDDAPYARTIMALNEEGTRLYLMIADGKRAEYSLGLHCKNAAAILKALGASNAMACDQGGSSCMFLKNLDGLVNRPADSDGIERPVYTHFGIRLKNLGE